MAGQVFQVLLLPGEPPAYTFLGGTREVSEMAGLGVGELLQYIHLHWSPNPASPGEEGKSEGRARELLARAGAEEGVVALRLLHRALMAAPVEAEGLEAEAARRQEELCTTLGLEEGRGAGEQDWVSHKLRVEWGKGRGRYVVTSAKVEVGEELVREQPAVSLLHHSHLPTNCLSCLLPVVRAVPCASCSSVLFCSLACRGAAAAHHALECGHLPALPGSGPLAPVLRLLTSMGREEAVRVAAGLPHLPPPPTGPLEEQGGVVGLQAGTKTSSQYRIDTAAQAYFLLTVLKTLGYFEDSSPAGLGAEHFAIGALLNHLVKVSGDNCHEVCELRLPTFSTPTSFDDLFQHVEEVVQVVGVAIYPRMSLFNNSCDVNTVKFQRGRQEVLVARRGMEAGEEVTDFYGEHFFQADRWARRAALGFPCCCPACREGWPLLGDLPTFSMAEVEERYEWALARVALEQAVTKWDVEEVERLCRALARSAGVGAPHEALVMPGLYLHYAATFLGANASIPFTLAYRAGKNCKK